MRHESLSGPLSTSQCAGSSRGRIAGAVFAVALCAAVSADAQVIYSSIPNPLPGNVISAGAQAFGYNEIGDGLIFTAGSGRVPSTVRIVLTSFACTSGHWDIPLGQPGACVTSPVGATFAQPITLNIRAVNANLSAGPLLATVTQSFSIPYRPSSDARCAPNGIPGGDGEEWYNAADNSCNHGLAVPITFDLSGFGLTLPDRVIVSVTYNTSDFGPNPIGHGTACFGTVAGCPYDSLNVSTEGSAIIGANVDPDGIYVNWTNPAFSCSGTESGSLQLDTPCWTGLHPQIEVVASAGIGPLEAFQVRYASNLNIGDSVINLTNTGTLTLPGNIASTGNMCVNVYAFDASEEMISCCSCLVTPNGLNSLSVRTDVISNTLTSGVPTSVVIKLLATTPLGLTPAGTGGSCNPSSPVATPAAAGVAGSLVPGMRAWGTTLHAVPTTPVSFGVTETEFDSSILSPAELRKLTLFCGFIQSNGSGFGICKACRTGGLGATTK